MIDDNTGKKINKRKIRAEEDKGRVPAVEAGTAVFGV